MACCPYHHLHHADPPPAAPTVARRRHNTITTTTTTAATAAPPPVGETLWGAAPLARRPAAGRVWALAREGRDRHDHLRCCCVHRRHICGGKEGKG